MIEDGLEEEALLFYKHKDINALKTVGYSEWWPYFEKEISKEMAIEKIKQHTRNYAKRQVTWFKNQSIIQQ
jgi:tRNA dimethylallyltransferase